jgi:hypothetical protein
LHTAWELNVIEKHLLMARVFQCPSGQSVIASLMITGCNTTCFQIIFSADPFENGIDLLTLDDIGDDNRIGPISGHMVLIATIDQSAVNSPPDRMYHQEP